MSLHKRAGGLVNSKRLLVSIWVRPTATLQYILLHCPSKYVLNLTVLGGITRAVGRAFAQTSPHNPSDQQLVLASITGALLGWLTTFCYGSALSTVGRWLGGRADANGFRTVIAWAMVPLVSSLGLFTLRYNLSRPDLIASASIANYWKYLELIFTLLHILLSVWTIIFLLKGINLLQGFGLGRSALNAILPGLIIIAFISLFVGFDKQFSFLLQ